MRLRFFCQNYIDKSGLVCYNENIMDIELIQKAGLTRPQATIYLELVQNGKLTPAEIAERTGETRTNTYAILNKLEQLGLVRNVGKRVAQYQAENPANLEALAERRRKIASKNEQELKGGMSALIDMFYAANAAPGSRTLTGREGIREIHRDVINTGETVYLIRTPADSERDDLITVFREQRAAKGIKTIALTPATPHAKQYMVDGTDKKYLFERTMMPLDAYESPVEIMIYGKKVALISYGETEIATIITSPLIAEAFREIFAMLQAYWREKGV